MRVLHLVSGSLDRGAARGAYWLHKALLETDVNSILVTNTQDNSGGSTVVSIGESPWDKIKYPLLRRLGSLPVRFYPKRKPWIFNTGFTGVDFTKLPEYHQADVVHLHWINNLVAMRTLRKVKKPIVWTMRDMWPLTGGCHYAMDCDRYKVGCGRCQQLQSNREWDLSRLIVTNKLTSLPRQLRGVAISHWLSECASSSRVFADIPVQMISNNIDTREFSPVAVDKARKMLKLPADKKIIMVGAQSVTVFFKGFDLFLKAMKGVKEERVHVVTFGLDAGREIAQLGVSQTHLGFLSDTQTLRLAYAAADVFVAPSLMDAFGKTLAEAQACGTPVVCFDATGPKDIVEHQVTGYKASPFEPLDLAKGIKWVLDLSMEQHEVMRSLSRKRAVERFDSRAIACQYKSLYEEMLANFY